MIIRECRPPDVELLEQHIPSPGLSRFHHARFDRQLAGLGTYLVAWSDDVPEGVAEVRWDGCAAPEVRRSYFGCPELNGLTVWPPTRQSRGTGTALVTAAEGLASDRGLRWIGLGVGVENDRAARLYHRLGYVETGLRYLDRHHQVEVDGTRREVVEAARFLVKELN